jgi:hypothetical protein
MARPANCATHRCTIALAQQSDPKDKDQIVVEYSLAGYGKPIGVAQWERQITRSLPDELKSSLPKIEEIEAELGGDLG